MTGNGNQAIYAYRDGTVYNPTTPGVNGYLTTNKSVIKLDITPGGGGNDDPITPVVWSNILPKDMDATLTVNAVITTGDVYGATVRLENTFEDIVYEATLDSTDFVVFEDFHKGEYVVTVELNGFESEYYNTEVSLWGDENELTAHFTEVFKPIEGLQVSGTGYAQWEQILPTTRVPERYKVVLDNIFQGETTDNYMVLDTEGLEIGEEYTVKVAVVYSTGMSDWAEANFTFIDCATVAQQVEELEGYSNCMNTVLTWNGGSPTPGPGPTPPTPPTPGDD
jgi:hypothetical protein